MMSTSSCKHILDAGQYPPMICHRPDASETAPKLGLHTSNWPLQDRYSDFVTSFFDSAQLTLWQVPYRGAPPALAIVVTAMNFVVAFQRLWSPSDFWIIEARRFKTDNSLRYAEEIRFMEQLTRTRTKAERGGVGNTHPYGLLLWQ